MSPCKREQNGQTAFMKNILMLNRIQENKTHLTSATLNNYHEKWMKQNTSLISVDVNASSLLQVTVWHVGVCNQAFFQDDHCMGKLRPKPVLGFIYFLASLHSNWLQAASSINRRLIWTTMLIRVWNDSIIEATSICTLFTDLNILHSFYYANDSPLHRLRFSKTIKK